MKCAIYARVSPEDPRCEMQLSNESVDYVDLLSGKGLDFVASGGDAGPDLLGYQQPAWCWVSRGQSSKGLARCVTVSSSVRATGSSMSEPSRRSTPRGR